MADGGFFDRDIQYVKGVGPLRAKALARLGIHKVRDMIFHFPRLWLDRTNIKKISALAQGEKESASGVVVSKGTIRIRHTLKITKVTIKDETGYISGVWYNQPYMEKQFNKGDSVVFHGKVDFYRGALQMSTPEYEITGGEGAEEDETVNVNRIVPVYPLTDTLTQVWVRKMIKTLLDTGLKYEAEFMPGAIAEKYGLMELKRAVYNVHFPESAEELNEAKKRLIFDEFFILQLALASRRKKIKEKKGFVMGGPAPAFEAVIKGLPFKLTGAQLKALADIRADMESGRPMNRLLQGDVGSGKTIVALLACLCAKDSGFQSAVMAPTELLAQQHMNSVKKFMEGSGAETVLLLGGMRKKERDAALGKISSGEADIIIGTHALIQEDVAFKKLGFIVIDEQHRFGVMQRAKLFEKSIEQPHSLIMTATPIPRTLSLTVYGDTDITVIDEMPPGRKKVETVLFEGRNKDGLYRFIDTRLAAGDQIYAVYPLVDDSDKLNLKSAMAMEKEWEERFKPYAAALVHGRMKKEERDAVMEAFKAKKRSILVATTIIEVGIDVPDASVIVIEHAERFGLSQLHQLRGRVGRGEKQSYCILVGRASTEDSIKRLNIMVNTSDGFRISEEDLEIRGAGEFMGTRQHGIEGFKIASIVRDRDIMEKAREAAFSVVSGECDIGHGNKDSLFAIIRSRYGTNFDLINVG
ncbi:MAG TPA: ATP-dependent DNA helicase RecG [bacterium]|nr:ATP-dependent DNA helicase RecG [bacterium]